MWYFGCLLIPRNALPCVCMYVCTYGRTTTSTNRKNHRYRACVRARAARPAHVHAQKCRLHQDPKAHEPPTHPRPTTRLTTHPPCIRTLRFPGPRERVPDVTADGVDPARSPRFRASVCLSICRCVIAHINIWICNHTMVLSR